MKLLTIFIKIKVSVFAAL